jgi:hypothetical protein
MAKDVNEALRALEKLLAMFRFERMVYLGVTVVALIILLALACWLLVSDKEGSTALALGMFGSSGLITFTTSRLLTMWNQAFELIRNALTSEVSDGK